LQAGVWLYRENNWAVRITEAEVNQVLSTRLMAIGDVKWSIKDHPDYAEAKVKIAHEQEGLLVVILTASLAVPKRYSFSLVYRGEPVKRLEINGRPHTNRCKDKKKFLWETHKHVYSDECGMSWAYAPSDITTDELKPSFLQFCAECGITFEGAWSTLPPSPHSTGMTTLGLEK
jgi:hypothetical protein